MTSDQPGTGLQSSSPLLGHSSADLTRARTRTHAHARTRAHDAQPGSFRARLGVARLGRRTVGIALLMVTVFLWTASNFLASFILSDATFNKPFFVVYLNTSMFALSLVPMSAQYVRQHGSRAARLGLAKLLAELRQDVVNRVRLVIAMHAHENDNEHAHAHEHTRLPDDDKVSLRDTTWLSLEFCMLWFAANYLAVACLEYTSVASATIFTSLSGIFTLLFCALARVEAFTLRKLAGVVASVAGIALVSSVDLSGSSADDDSRGSFPSKSAAEMALGDAMALLSSVVYGAYVTVMKQRVGNEDRVSMPLFFGLVGLFNVVLLWPGFVLLHVTGIEPFVLPPTGQVWTIVLVNAASSFLSDMTWAYAMLLTTPLVVTVGLSLTIPLSLVGEMVQYQKYATGLYWAGALVVVASFLFVNHESHEPDEAEC